MTAPDFHIPTGEDIIKKNEGVYKKVVRKGYDKEFVEPGCTVVCHVTGFLPDEEDKVFWSTKGGNPFSYKAGIGKYSEAISPSHSFWLLINFSLLYFVIIRVVATTILQKRHLTNHF